MINQIKKKKNKTTNIIKNFIILKIRKDGLFLMFHFHQLKQPL
jgi:hypothetical protein